MRRRRLSVEFGLAIVASLLVLCASWLTGGGSAAAAPNSPIARARTVTASQCAAVTVVAHRGGILGRDKVHTEDSLGSFRDVAALAADAAPSGLTVTAETDIWPTKANADGDRAWVSNHDRTLDRTTTGTGRIADHTWHQLRPVRYDDGEPLTRFGPAVAYLATTRAHFQVEIKPERVTSRSLRALIHIVLKNHMRHRFEFTSFHADTLRHVHRVDPTIRLGYLTFGDTVPAGMTDVVQEAHFKSTSTTADGIAAVQAAGLEVGVWAPDSPTEWQTYIEDGTNAITTDEARTYYDWCVSRTP